MTLTTLIPLALIALCALSTALLRRWIVARRNLRSIEREEWIPRASWMIDVHARPMEVGEDID